MELPTYTCQRCGYTWHPRTNKEPKVCASKKCKSPYWNRPRKLSTATKKDAQK